MQSHSEMKRTR